jgi:hypothetical protein
LNTRTCQDDFDLDDLIAEITIDCYDEDEALSALAAYRRWLGG